MTDLGDTVELDTVAVELQRALLNSVSHNLRAPLASIIGVLDSLMEDHRLLDEQTKLELLRSAREEAERLNRLVGNLLERSEEHTSELQSHSDLVCRLLL